jgi:hypothetical protein
MQIVKNEVNKKRPSIDPNFITSYDNKYNEKTVFATDDGRYKKLLNINDHDKEILKNAEKS